MRERGFRLTLKGAGLGIRPASKLTDDDRDLIRQSLGEMLAYLRANSAVAASLIHEFDSRTIAPSFREDFPEELIALDNQRRERDHVNRRGFDFNCSSVFHREHLQQTGSDCECLHDGHQAPVGRIERRDYLDLAYVIEPKDDCARPYVTTGPYCPWPEAGFGAKTENGTEGTPVCANPRDAFRKGAARWHSPAPSRP